ncbi:SRPBCC domain-containing protein [Pseudarthrobacter sp. NPDC058329]|uniref:SRPBCC family protein n=1 Tax=Pseudarthrobacter sp. NPDC058329 TaxID=3346448 RepID=UPI0036DCABBC
MTMQTQHFSITINAPKEKVWHAMLDDQTYREWTTAFSEGSYFEGAWEEGSKMLFLGPDPETGVTGGMVSRIARCRPFEFVSIEHLGIMNDGVEDTTSDEARKWAPAYENYTFTEKDGMTELVVDSDTDEEQAAEFEKMWQVGLQRLKEIAERT